MAATPPTLGVYAFSYNADGRKIYVPNKATYTAVASWNDYSSSIEAFPNGSCGEGVTWSLISGVLTISKTGEGTGAMTNYANDSYVPWFSNRSNVTSVVIEEGVTSVGNYAFNGCSYLASVSIPATVTSIGESAFEVSGESASSLTVTFATGSQLETIGKNAFSYTKLAAIALPNNVKTIGELAFNMCPFLASVTWPTGLTTIGYQAFSNTALTTVALPANVTSIGDYAFKSCSNLATVTLNSNPFIGDYAFDDIKDGATVTMNLTANLAGDAKWMTFYNQNYRFQADANTQVFKVELKGIGLTMHEVGNRIVDAGTAVVLKKTGDDNPVMTLTTTASGDTQTNNLTGVSAVAGVTSDGTIYVLNYTAANGVGFYKLKSGKTLGVGKAYLTYSGEAREYFLFDETTDIEDINRETITNNRYYDMQGRRVANPTKGLYIVNGKKFVIK